ncbi:MAG: RNA polymerase subunit sigma, partial [SAR324 cluster bacterium]|nr:RNA polymerase subunit sigma [SAR324 cluster bacterium]
MLNPSVIKLWQKHVNSEGNITVLTGAGISAESGLPTFRGKDGYWTIGSREYHPQEMATFSMFSRNPEDVWRWYLYRLAKYRHAEPNAGHQAIAEMEQRLGDRFMLITQNVDGLHLKAGNSPERTFQIHGNINFMRCARECSLQLYPLPDEIPCAVETREVHPDIFQKLICPRCGYRTRPHVLWFGETYDEEHFRFQSSIEVIHQTNLLLIVGTSLAVSLP